MALYLGSGDKVKITMGEQVHCTVWKQPKFDGLVPKQDVNLTWSSDNGAYYTKIAVTDIPTLGETYTVQWDGETYTCLCRDCSGSWSGIGTTLQKCLGNPYMRKRVAGYTVTWKSENTGEPFAIAVYDDNTLTIYSQTSGTHTLIIY